jgi:hypothetical protein
MIATAHNLDERATILAALDRFIRQRPGLEFGNYGDWSAYRAEVRSIGRDLQHARALLAYVERHPSIDAERLKAAFRDAYSGRLSWDGARLDYCTGQYWPTEYRKAACAVLASAIWSWWRDECMPAPDAPVMNAGYYGLSDRQYGGKSAGDWLRVKARREFDRGVAARWFN